MTLAPLIKQLSSLTQISLAKDLLKKGEKKLVFSGLPGSSRAVSIASISQGISGSGLVICPSSAEAEEVYNDLINLLGKSAGICFCPAPDTIPYESTPVDIEIAGSRQMALLSFLEGQCRLLIAPVKSVISWTSSPASLRKKFISLKQGMRVSPSEIVKKLVRIGYRRVDIVGERGDVSVRGGILDVFPSFGDHPARVDFFGDEIETIRLFDVRTQRSTSEIKHFQIPPVSEDAAGFTLIDYLATGSPVFLVNELHLDPAIKNLFVEAEKAKVDEETLSGQKTKFKGKPYLTHDALFKGISENQSISLLALEMPQFMPGPEVVNFDLSSPKSHVADLPALARDLKGQKLVFIVSRQAHRVVELLAEEGIAASFAGEPDHCADAGPVVLSGELSRGYSSSDPGILVLTDREIFGERTVKGQTRTPSLEGIDRSLLIELTDGDFVVHEKYGIGVYRGLERLSFDEVEQEYLLIEYAEADKLYVPLSQMGLVSRYSSPDEFTPKINRLSGAEWARTKTKAMKSIEDLTSELLDIYASRETSPGHAFPADSVWQTELEAGFPFEETEDQRRAIDEVKRDMESERPMDRLVCGDVGYGKTEVALRAAFKAAAAHKQVALLVPTTILAEQHFNNFNERFAPFPVKVEMLSRFRSRAMQDEIISRLAVHDIDIIIGTHRLLQKDIRFSDLGLVIIDEEQRFGVAHKEKLKKLRKTVDVMTLTATPIPRTLYFSLSGARDLSMIATAPADRSPIKTYVLEWREQIVREAIVREMERGGQVYYVHNCVEDIEQTAKKLRELVPSARISVAHGQMSEGLLEKAMLDLMKRQSDVLLCTTIIESGIDIANVNTIIIDHAPNFGLAQLYQLRGRVGRSPVRAFAYLLYHKNDIKTDSSLERLRAIEEFTSLGSGYRLALRDLEIRGAGNLLGRQQHGHMLALGFDLYFDLVQRAVEHAKGIQEISPQEIEIDLKVNAYIPDAYISDERQRIAYYRRMNMIRDDAELKDMTEELVDRFGQVPNVLKMLFEMIGLKVKARSIGIKKIEERGSKIYVEYLVPPKEAAIKRLLSIRGGEYRAKEHRAAIFSPERGAEKIAAVKDIIEAAR